MQKGKLVAIAIGIAITIAVGAAFAISMQTDRQELEPTGTTEGREIVVNIEEKLGVSEGQSP